MIEIKKVKKSFEDIVAVSGVSPNLPIMLYLHILLSSTQGVLYQALPCCDGLRLCVILL